MDTPINCNTGVAIIMITNYVGTIPASYPFQEIGRLPESENNKG